MRKLFILIAFACLFNSAVLAEAGVYSDTVLADNPLAYWRLGEAAGPTVADETSNGHDGTATAGVLFGQSSLLDGEPTDTAIGTSGSERVVVPAFEKFPTGSTGYTAEYWLTVNSAPTGYHNIVGDGDGVDFYMMNYLTTTSQIRPHFAGAGTTSIDSNTVLQVGQTYHVATTWDKTTGLGSIYIDGKLDQQATVGTGGPANSNNALYLGKDNREPGGEFTLDEVAFYNRPLAAEEIAWHDHAGRNNGSAMAASLSTDVLGPGTFNDGYNNNSGDSTVELVRRIPNKSSLGQTGPYVEAYTQNPADTIDFSSWVVAGDYAGNWGSDQHGRGGNIWLPGDGETDEPHVGFGAHGAMFITFDLDDIRAEHFYGFGDPLQLTGRVGTNGNVTLDPPNGVILGGVWLDGDLLDMSPNLSKNDPSHAIELLLPGDGRYLTLALLNGASTVWDDAAFRDMTLTMVPEPGTFVLLGLGTLGLLLPIRRRRK